MNKEWAELNKSMQMQLKKQDTFTLGIDTLLNLRQKLMMQIMQFRDELSVEDFSAMPFKKAEGYHSKTIAYSIWHIFRIEDIVVHSLIAGDEQVFFSGNYKERTHSPIITTGNELGQEEIEVFSRELCVDELYNYMVDVDKATTHILRSLSYKDSKIKIDPAKKKYLDEIGVVSNDESAHWLIDYWCGKDVRGLIQMPLSRHWIMHIEACLRIKSKLLSD